MVHPVLQKRKYLIYYLSTWLVIGIVHTIILNHFYGFSHWISFVDGFVFYSLFGIIAIGLWYTVNYSDIDNPRLMDVVINHGGAAAITLIIWYFTGYFLLRQIFADNSEYLTFLNLSIPWRFTIGVFLYLLIILIYYLVISYRNLQEKISNEAELKSLVKETELSLLKSQINPHFLFNSLNSISSLTITNPAKAQEMIIKLSDFLRHSIGHKEKQMISLSEEIDHILLYLDIEKVRFGERLLYKFEMEEACKKFEVPCMILQPLFENAVKHGVYESSEEVIISFVCESCPDGISLRISNNFDSEAAPRKGNGMGIKNITNRLRLIYQRDDLLKITKYSSTFEVEMLIPK
jgi:two-component system, LytTR family, sensor kinase